MKLRRQPTRKGRFVVSDRKTAPFHIPLSRKKISLHLCSTLSSASTTIDFTSIEVYNKLVFGRVACSEQKNLKDRQTKRQVGVRNNFTPNETAVGKSVKAALQPDLE
jgi:hypothetical protein